MLKSSSRIFDFLKKDVLNKAEQYFSFDEPQLDDVVSEDQAPFRKILVLPNSDERSSALGEYRAAEGGGRRWYRDLQHDFGKLVAERRGQPVTKNRICCS